MMQENGNRHIRLVALQGSVRPGNYTARALALVADEARKLSGMEMDIIDPTDMRMLMPGMGDTPDTKRMQAAVAGATGVIIASPEYHGSFSSVIKLMIDNLGFPSVLSGKPVALLGVAAGRIGAIKALEHLRSVASHVGGIVLPGPVSIASVQSVFDEDGSCLDPGAEKMIRGVVTNLMHYIEQNICPRLALENIVRGVEME